MHLFLSKLSILLYFFFKYFVIATELSLTKFGKYEVVHPLKISQPKKNLVPPDILRPAYVYNTKEDEPPHILIKNKHEIECIRSSGRLAKSVIDFLRKRIRVGMTTSKLDSLAHDFIVSHGAYPSPLGYEGFPKSICTSVNNIIIHGIPDSRKLKSGDIISVDVTVYLNGYHGDTAETFLVGKVDEAGRNLVKGTQEILYAGIQCCGPNVSFEKLADVISKAAKERGFTVIQDVLGHGIGTHFHEPPDVYHEWSENSTNSEEMYKKVVMRPGMVFTVEPAIGQGGGEIALYDDDWTMSTLDNSRTAHFEHTIAITDKGYEILTQ